MFAQLEAILCLPGHRYSRREISSSVRSHQNHRCSTPSLKKCFHYDAEKVEGRVVGALGLLLHFDCGTPFVRLWESLQEVIMRSI